MIQEKQLKELFKYIEQNWDVCVSQVDKTDIKRIFGGVLCDDIMNDTLHEVKAEPEEQKGNCSTFDGSRLVDQVQPALNPIELAYESGIKIRHKGWHENSWIQKLSETEAIDELKKTYDDTIWAFRTEPHKWELYTEPEQVAEPTEQPAPNPIAEAYERGEKIRHKNWLNGDWIQKHKETKTIDNHGNINSVYPFAFIQHPEKWELYTEPTEQPAKPFDKDRFEAMFRAVVANGGHELDHKEAIELTEQALKQLDAYYAEKGGNNE